MKSRTLGIAAILIILVMMLAAMPVGADSPAPYTKTPSPVLPTDTQEPTGTPIPPTATIEPTGTSEPTATHTVVPPTVTMIVTVMSPLETPSPVPGPTETPPTRRDPDTPTPEQHTQRRDDTSDPTATLVPLLPESGDGLFGLMIYLAMALLIVAVCLIIIVTRGYRK